MSQSTETDILRRLDDVLKERLRADPESSYVAKLLAAGPNGVLEKIGEEATEVILAAKDHGIGEDPQALVGEVADLWFHCLVLLAQQGLVSSDVLDCLAERFGLSGLEEKASRQ